MESFISKSLKITMELSETSSDSDFAGFPDEPGPLRGFTEKTDEAATILKRTPKTAVSNGKFVEFLSTTQFLRCVYSC